MRKILIPMLSATLLAGCATAATTSGTTSYSAKEEARLAKRLEGRVAGKPVDCILQRNIRSSQIYGETIVYEGNGGTLYVNRPRAGGAQLRFDPILVTNTHTDQLCSIDVVRLVDRSAQFATGSVFLDKFVPYRKVRN